MNKWIKLFTIRIPISRDKHSYIDIKGNTVYHRRRVCLTIGYKRFTR